MIRRLPPARHFFHGDITDDGTRFYSRRGDLFLPLPTPVFPSDIAISKRELERGWVILGHVILADVPGGRGIAFRPTDARNVFQDHPWMEAHPSTLRALVRQETRLRDMGRRNLLLT